MQKPKSSVTYMSWEIYSNELGQLWQKDEDTEFDFGLNVIGAYHQRLAKTLLGHFFNTVGLCC